MSDIGEWIGEHVISGKAPKPSPPPKVDTTYLDKLKEEEEAKERRRAAVARGGSSASQYPAGRFQVPAKASLSALRRSRSSLPSLCTSTPAPTLSCW